MLDDFGDRMKAYEALTDARLLPKLPVCARLDGRTFHTFTKHAHRPFSEGLHRLMVDVTEHLVAESVADVGYTQSDEITLCWADSVPFFDGRVQKMASALAAMASVKINAMSVVVHDTDGTMGGVRLHRENALGLKWGMLPTFDCRVWALPTRAEAANVFLWRQIDAARNSVQMAARYHLGHAKCQDRDSKELQELLFQEKHINWSEYPFWAKRGTFVKHAKTRRAFTAEEIEALPPLHDARKNPDLVVERRILRQTDIDLRGAVNREAALFMDEAP